MDSGTIPDPRKRQSATADSALCRMRDVAGEDQAMSTTELVEFDSAIYQTVAEYARHRLVDKKTVLGWIWRGMLPAVKATVPLDEQRSYKTKWQWAIRRDLSPDVCVHAYALPQFREIVDGVEIVWVSIQAARRRRQCSKWALAQAIKSGAIESRERQLSSREPDRTRTYVRADQLIHVQIREFPTAEERSAGKTQLKRRDKSGARIVRTADGWRIAQNGRRSKTEWTKRSDVEKALQMGKWE